MNRQIAFNVVLTCMMLLQVTFANGQITIMQKPKVKGYSVAVYDSLTNFEEKYYGQENPEYQGKRTFHHLIGQTIIYCGAGYKNCQYGAYYKISSIIYKNNLPYLVLTNKKTRNKIQITGITYNSQFVVQGHYEKVKKIYKGKKFIYTANRFSSENYYYIVSSGNYANMEDGSVWTCCDVQVEDRRDKLSHKYSPVLLVFKSNDSSRKVYCYYEAFYNMEELTDTYTSDDEKRKEYFISKYGKEYGTALYESRLEEGMTKEMVESFFGSGPGEKSTSIKMEGYKTVKEEKWVYRNKVYDENGKPLKVIISFDEREKLKSWTAE